MKITVIMYPKEENCITNDSVNIEKTKKKYLQNTCVFNVNPGNQGSPIIFNVQNVIMRGYKGNEAVTKSVTLTKNVTLCDY
jgi:hypothetical protein